MFFNVCPLADNCRGHKRNPIASTPQSWAGKFGNKASHPRTAVVQQISVPPTIVLSVFPKLEMYSVGGYSPERPIGYGDGETVRLPPKSLHCDPLNDVDESEEEELLVPPFPRGVSEPATTIPVGNGCRECSGSGTSSIRLPKWMNRTPTADQIAPPRPRPSSFLPSGASSLLTTAPPSPAIRHVSPRRTAARFL